MGDSSSSKAISKKQDKYIYMQNRELSWLEFNKRVLDQGADEAVPLFERLNFISIFWSNLQEFFMIRVGSLGDLALVKEPIIDSKSGMTPQEQLDAVYKRCHELMPYYDECYKHLGKELEEQGVVNHKVKTLNDEQRSFVELYFDENIMPFLSPQIINSTHPFPHLENGALYVVVRLDEEADKHSKKKHEEERVEKDVKAQAKDSKDDKGKGKKKRAKSQGAEGVTLGIIPMPTQCQRIVRLPGEGLQFMLLEHVIEMFVDKIYHMYKVKHTNVVCVTRNADLDATEGSEEQGADYRDHIKRILKKRKRLTPVRLESERELSPTVLPVLLKRLKLKHHQAFVTSVPLDMSYVFSLPQMVSEEMQEELSLTPFTPQWPDSIDRDRSIIEQIEDKDILVSYPYETVDTFVELLREAIKDPDVVSIKITLYRLASHSHIAEALIAAADAGKEVTALFELRARFDESNNIEWSQRFEEAGCNVIYGFHDYKVHSKICCITKRKGGGLEYITQLGTGNYNEKTSRLYTDFSFMTADQAIGRDAAEFFRNMALETVSDNYDTLCVAPLQIKQKILEGIDEQIANKRAGKPAGLFFKTNSITDKQIIDKIVEASQAGVTSVLLVRGISCIVPGIEGYTDNVCVVSIVGRLLEHSRIYFFGAFDGDFKIYLSSADLMTRNMDKRVEVAWPVEDDDLQQKILGYIATCLADTAKLRDLMPNKKYTDLGYFAREDADNGEVVLFDSQNYLINEANRHQMEVDEQNISLFANDVLRVRDTEEEVLAVERADDALGASEDEVRFDVNAVEERAGKAEIGAEEGNFLTVEEDIEQTNAENEDHLPHIDGLYAPEHNPEGIFTVPKVTDESTEVTETTEIDRAGGPIIVEDESSDGGYDGGFDAFSDTQRFELESMTDLLSEAPESSTMFDVPVRSIEGSIPKEKPSLFKRIFGL